MVIRRIHTDSPDSDSKPFANEYITQGGSIGDMSVIETVIVSASGNLFIIAEDFKGTLYKNSASMKFALEAIDYWMQLSQSKHPVCYLEVLTGGKVALAIDDELIESSWIKETKGWKQVVGKTGDSMQIQQASNPLLAYTTFSPPPTTKTRARTNSAKDSSIDETSK